MKIFVSEKARQDILRTSSYLAERNPSAAENLLRAIDKNSKSCRASRSSVVNDPERCLGFAVSW
jgi:plasmid stabilization system protein ParE